MPMHECRTLARALQQRRRVMTSTDHLDLTTSAIEQPVQRMLGDPNASVVDWSETPLSGSLNPGTLRISRISGTASPDGVADESAVPFSIVAKILAERTPGTDPSHRTYWKREALAYSSDLFDHLPEGIRAPEFYGVEELSDTVVRIWLEDLGDVKRRYWSAAEYERAARLVGRLNAHPLPSEFEPPPNWWSRNASQHWFEAMDSFMPRLEKAKKDPFIGPLWSDDSINKLYEIRRTAPQLIELLAELPASLSHGDVHAGNLSMPERGTRADSVLFDWSDLGLRPLGTDLSVLPQVAAIMHEYDADALGELDQLIFASYIKGLADVGWSGDVEGVRRGFAASCVVRGYVLAEVLQTNPATRGRAEAMFGAKTPEFLRRMSQTRSHAVELIRELEV